MSEKQSSNHLDDAKDLCVLYHEQVVLRKFIIPFIRRSIPCIARNLLSERFDESDALEQEHGDLAVHLAHVHGHWVVYYCELVLYFDHQIWAKEDLDEVLLALYALKGCPMLDVQSDDLEELRQEANAEEELSWTVQTPVQELK